MYFQQIRESLISSLAPQAINNELRSANLVPVASPVINDISFEEGKPLKLKAEFEVWPEFELPEYKNTRVKKKKKPVSAKEINQSLEDLREKSAQYEPISDRGVMEGDYVYAEIVGMDSKTKKLLPTEKAFILAGHQDNEEALNENIIGLKTNEERKLSIHYDKDHRNKRLAGRKIEYSLKALSIKEKKLPEMDDSFAKEIGKFESLKDLKAEIRKQLKTAVKSHTERELSAEIIQKIADKVDFELPDTIVKQETLVNINQFLQAQQHQSLSKEGMNKIQKEAKEKAERNIKNHLILNKIAEAEKLEVSEEDISKELDSIAKANKMPLASVRQAMDKEDKLEELKQNLLLRKTVDFLVKKAIIE
jgi:trigger factor